LTVHLCARQRRGAGRNPDVCGFATVMENLGKTPHLAGPAPSLHRNSSCCNRKRVVTRFHSLLAHGFHSLLAHGRGDPYSMRGPIRAWKSICACVTVDAYAETLTSVSFPASWRILAKPPLSRACAKATPSRVSPLQELSRIVVLLQSLRTCRDTSDQPGVSATIRTLTGLVSPHSTSTRTTV
jgi:hypothetical protein